MCKKKIFNFILQIRLVFVWEFRCVTWYVIVFKKIINCNTSLNEPSHCDKMRYLSWLSWSEFPAGVNSSYGNSLNRQLLTRAKWSQVRNMYLPGQPYVWRNASSVKAVLNQVSCRCEFIQRRLVEQAAFDSWQVESMCDLVCILNFKLL